MKKKCKGGCEDIKPLSEFYKKAKNADGHDTFCNVCRRKQCAEYRAKNCKRCQTRPKARGGYCVKCSQEIEEKPEVIIDGSKRHCPRGRGSIIATADCEENQGCNDACFTCGHFKEDKTLNSMSMEEREEAKYTHQSVMAHEYDYDE